MDVTLSHVESNTKIYYTTDYGRFKFLKGNRDINESKVNKIKEVIEAGVDVLRYAPIIVNEAMEIIDGQHRFTVSMQLRTNVYYVMHKEATLSIVPTINSNHTKWRNVDFLNSYLDLKKPAYLALQDFINEFHGISLNTAIKMFNSGTPQDGAAIEHFRDGNLSDKHKAYSYSLANTLQTLKPYTDNPFSSRFFLVMMQLQSNGLYDHSQMLRKLEETGMRIESVKTVKTIIQEMEQIINHRAKNRIIIH
jgi:glutaredoxin-related protein